MMRDDVRMMEWKINVLRLTHLPVVDVEVKHRYYF
jgi:hypothetical protein